MFVGKAVRVAEGHNHLLHGMSSCDHYCGTREYSRCWLNKDVGGLFPFELGEIVLFYAMFLLSGGSVAATDGCRSV